jgi:two-component system sensor histidine kinase KdpD
MERAARAIERLRVEEEIRSMDALRERERLRSTLLSSIGHDLRTPLTALTAAAEALAAREEHSNLVSTIRGEAKRLRRFFDDLVDMTRIEAGSLAPRAEPVDLTDAASAAVDDVRLAMEAHEVRVDVSPDLPLVRTDPNLLHHILINLLDNAAKFSPAGSEVQLQGIEIDGGVELRVTDEGPGLPAGSEARVFETFARLEGSDRTGGSGLGLAIVKGFADAMGLPVRAANRQERKGARLSIFFPAELVVPQVRPGG